MKLLKNKYKLRCETGGCRNYAGYVLLMDRCGVHSSVYLCENCVNELKKALCAACENDDGLNEALLCKTQTEKPVKRAAGKGREKTAGEALC